MVSKSNSEAWTQYLRPHNLRLFVTVKYPRTERDIKLDSSDFHLQCIRDQNRYFYFVNKRSFGRKATSNPSFGLRYITFFENKTKFGNETVFHSHSIIGGTENPERLERHLSSQWKKVRRYCRSEPPHIVKIHDLPGLVGYATKQIDNGFEILTNLPPLDNAQLTRFAD